MRSLQGFRCPDGAGLLFEVWFGDLTGSTVRLAREAVPR
jgi:hypothetical protein